MSFNSLGLSDALLKASAKSTTPSPIQQKAIPPILEGKDVLASAQTGTGNSRIHPTIQTL
jgi:ATP-dependent RNA helicase RhlE